LRLPRATATLAISRHSRGRKGRGPLPPATPPRPWPVQRTKPWRRRAPSRPRADAGRAPRVWHCQSLAVSLSKPPSRSAELAAVDLVLPLEVVHVGRGEVEHDVVHSSASTRSSGSGPNLMFGLGNLSRCQTGITLGSVSSGAIIVSRNSIRRTLYLTRTEMNTGSFLVPCTNRDSVFYIKCSYLYTMSYYEKKRKGAAELASALRHVRHARHGPERACHDDSSAASGSGDGRLGHGGAGRAEPLRQACGGLCASSMGRPVRLRQA
jgi:hypothetical protein